LGDGSKSLASEGGPLNSRAERTDNEIMQKREPEKILIGSLRLFLLLVLLLVAAVAYFTHAPDPSAFSLGI
jgi:hypothetical protein